MKNLEEAIKQFRKRFTEAEYGAMIPVTVESFIQEVWQSAYSAGQREATEHILEKLERNWKASDNFNREYFVRNGEGNPFDLGILSVLGECIGYIKSKYQLSEKEEK